MMALCIVLALAAWTDSASDWEAIPIYGGGYVQNVVIAPSSPNVWYAYVDVGGPYRSDDAGLHWRPLHGNFSIEDRNRNADHVRTLSVDPRNADRIVLVGGNRYENPGGIYASTDGGKSFRCRQTARFYGNGQRRMYGLCLARNPSNPDELIAGEDWDGLFRSVDNGQTWTSVGPKEHWFTDIRYDKVVLGRVYACAPDVSDTPGVSRDMVRKSGLWRSDDSGLTWKRLGDSAPVEIAQRDGTEELLGSFPPKATRLRLSSDGGKSWSGYGEGLPEDSPDKPFYFTGFYALSSVRDVWLAGHAEGDVFVRRSQDSSWRKVPRESLALGDPQCEGHLSRLLESKRFEALCSIVVDSANARHWIATDWYFIWESFDAGRNWTARSNGMMTLVSFAIAFDPFNAERIHYGAADMGYFRSLDGGRSFGRPGGAIPYANCFAFSTRTTGLMFAAGGKWLGSLFRSLDGGVTWTSVSSEGGLPLSKMPRRGVYGVAVDPLTDDVYVTVGGKAGTGDGGIYRSTDNGRTWMSFSSGLPECVELFKNDEFSDGPGGGIEFSSDGSCVLSTRRTRQLWYLDRGSSAWRLTNAGNTDGIVAADPSTPGRFVLCGEAMRESVDGGRMFRELPGMPHGFWSVSFDAHTSGLAVLGRSDGLWISRDGARTAERLEKGMGYPSGGDRRAFIDRRRIYAFTSGSGVWTRTLSSREAFVVSACGRCAVLPRNKGSRK